MGMGNLGVGATPISYPKTRNWVLVLFLQPYEQHGQEPRLLEPGWSQNALCHFLPVEY